MTDRELILGTVEDLVSSLLWYDRKEDEELPRGAIEAAIKRDEITVDEIVAQFRFELIRTLEHRYRSE